MKHVVYYFFLIVLIFSLTGCFIFGENGYIHDQSEEYLEASDAPRMQVPVDVDVKPIDDLYAIPPTLYDSSQAPDDFDVPRARSTAGYGDSDGISVQKAGNRRWILIDADPSVVWPKVLEFWQLQNIELSSANPSQGIMETAWITQVMRDENELMQRVFKRVFDRNTGQVIVDKFRVNLNHGVRRGSTEIHLLHFGLPITNENDLPDPTTVEWPYESTNITLEAGVMNEMLVHIARSAREGSAVSYQAQDLPATEKIALLKDGNGNPILLLNLGFERAWSGVGQALKDADIVVKDFNRELGIYYIEFIMDDDGQIQRKNKEKPGFFSRLFGNDQPDESKKDELQIKLSEVRDGVNVTVQQSANTLAPVDVSEQVLVLIKDYLI